MNKALTLLFSFFTLLASAQMTTHNYTFDDIHREFNIYIPTTYNPSTDTLPMVFFLHGMGGDMTNFSGLSYKAEQEKYIMVIPQAVSDPIAGTTWHSGAGTSLYYPNANVDDIGFLSSLIDSVSSWYNVNPDRVYSTGFSMGAFMSNRLACELSNRIAAIASIGGTIGNEIKNSCNPNNIIPVLHIHSTNDQTISFDNNSFGKNAVETVDFWINNNNCNTTADTTDLSNVANDGFTAVKYFYTGGDLNSEVEFYKLGGPQHNESWYTVSSGNDFDAVEVIWDFFERHNNKKVISIVEPTPNTITNIKKARMHTFPNPASKIITLDFSSKIELASISISNTLGKRISHKTYEEPITSADFDISDFASGVYYFQIEDIEGNLSVKRFYKK